MKLFAEDALLAGGWARHVVLEIGADGRLTHIARDVAAPPADAERLTGPVIPGMPNLHSHAFQRALAGRAERRSPRGKDSFWSWRQTMYEFVARLDPEAVEAIAAQLYVEMLKAGYTGVGEFHYLHHDPEGRPYAEPTEMSERVLSAAARAGIAITHLPVLYAHGGFGARDPSPGQRRFLHDLDDFGGLLEALAARCRGQPDVRLGVAPHSLRAVTPAPLHEALALMSRLDATAPVHIHIAEQPREVDECLEWCGRRPVAWLLDEMEVDARWCLVHATHMDREEIAALAASGATAGLCPTTEANLGDGVFPGVAYLEAGGQFGIGSDSHVTVSPAEELRTLEYTQRLTHETRALLADERCPSVGASLYTRAAAGGARALGMAAGTLAPGRRADLVVLDTGAPTLLERAGDLLLDALVFAAPARPVRDVMVGGQWRVVEGRHPQEEAILARFRNAQRRLAGA